MTREDAEAVVRSSTRTCRGKPIVPEGIQEAFFKHFDALDHEKTLSVLIVAMAGQVSPEMHQAFVTFAQGQKTIRSPRDTLIDALRAHEGDVGCPCGYDFNAIICGQPFDGLEHEYTCPQCGVVGTFRSPRFDEE